MGLRDRLRRLEAAAEGEMIAIPRRGGTTARFPQQDLAEAFLALMDGRDHPLAQAAGVSTDPEWSGSLFAAFPLDRDVEDLSER